MATSIAARKKARAQRKTSLRQKATERQSKTNYKDDRMWTCERDSTGKGDAVIRFLPPTDEMVQWYMDKFDFDELDVPCYINYHEHGFKGTNGKWFIEKCPTSVMERECPVCEANSELIEEFGGWDAVDDNHTDKKLVRNRKRKSRFVSNILVVRDPANPENEGQVKIFGYGKAIHDQIMAQLVPVFDDEEECDVSDEIEGRDFKLKIVKKDGYANYDKSSWADPSVVGGLDEDDEEAIEELLNKCHSLPELVSDSKYKSYDDLVKQFNKTQGKAAAKRSIEDSDGDDGGDDSPQGEEESKPTSKRAAARKEKAAAKPKAAEKPKPKVKEPVKKADPEPAGTDDDDDYFASLLEED